MDENLREMIRWLQNIEVGINVGRKLDEETYLLRLSTVRVLKKNNDLMVAAIALATLQNKLKLKELRNAIKRANKNSNS